MKKALVGVLPNEKSRNGRVLGSLVKSPLVELRSRNQTFGRERYPWTWRFLQGFQKLSKKMEKKPVLPSNIAVGLLLEEFSFFLGRYPASARTPVGF